MFKALRIPENNFGTAVKIPDISKISDAVLVALGWDLDCKPSAFPSKLHKLPTAANHQTVGQSLAARARKPQILKRGIRVRWSASYLAYAVDSSLLVYDYKEKDSLYQLIDCHRFHTGHSPAWVTIACKAA